MNLFYYNLIKIIILVKMLSKHMRMTLALLSSKKQLEYLTSERIENASNLKELLSDLSFSRIYENSNYRAFTRKLSSLVNEQELKRDEPLKKKLENLIFQMRRLSAAEVHSNTTDIINFCFLFKKVQDLFPNYKKEGFQTRLGMLLSNIPRVLPAEKTQKLGITLASYMTTGTGISTYEFKYNLIQLIVRRQLNYRALQGEASLFKNKENAQKIWEQDILAYIVNMSSYFQNKTHIYAQYSLFQMSIKNIHRHWGKVSSYLSAQLPTREKFISKNSDESVIKVLYKIELFINILNFDHKFPNSTSYTQIWFLQSQTLALFNPENYVMTHKICVKLLEAVISTNYYLQQSFIKQLSSKIWEYITRYPATNEQQRICELNICISLPYKMITNQEFYLKILKIVENETTLKQRLFLCDLYLIKSSLLNSEQWKDIFQKILSFDQTNNYWEIYFLIGKTEHRHLIRLQNIAKRVNKELTSIKAASFYDQEKEALKLYALLIRMNLEKDQGFRQEVSKYTEVSELEKIFENWAKSLCTSVDQVQHRPHFLAGSETDGVNYTIQSNPMDKQPTLKNLYPCLFTETRCYDQYQITKKIFSLPEIKQMISYKGLERNLLNFQHEFQLFLLSLGDKENLQFYLKEYSADSFIVKNLKIKQVFNMSEQIHQLNNSHQWEYFLKFLSSYGQVYLCHDVFDKWMAKIRRYNMISPVAFPLQEQNKCHRIIIQGLIDEIKKKKSVISNVDNRVSYILSYFLEKNCSPEIITQEELKQLVEICLLTNYDNTKALSNLIEKLERLGLVNKQNAQIFSKVYQSFDRQKATTTGYYILKHYLFTDRQKRKNIQGHIYRISSQLKGNFFWTLLSIKFLNTKKVRLLQDIISTHFKDPRDKQFLEKELQQALQRSKGFFFSPKKKN